MTSLRSPTFALCENDSTPRALTNLNKLFFLSQKFLKKDSVLVLLKGKKINEEISVAKKKWDFTYEIHQSKSDKTGKVIVIKNLKKTL